MSEDIVVLEESEDGLITTIRMNRPGRKNALNYAMGIALKEAFFQAERTKSRIIIFTGSDEFFSSGVDLKTLMGQDEVYNNQLPSDRKNLSRMRFNFMIGQRLSFMLQKIEKPIIARITGFCFGWAFELALACDFRFCLDSTQFGLLETKYGINPAQGGITNLVRNCGISVAKDVAITGRRFDGNEAYRLKIVNGVAKSVEELDAMIKNYTDELIDTAPLAVGLIKRSVDWMYGQDTNMGLEIEALVNSILMNTKDMKTSGVARMQKKKPEWRGR
ncbi:MAG: enoyl-CoA hydratase/isomerase family protein [Promethearchaeota archaeon]